MASRICTRCVSRSSIALYLSSGATNQVLPVLQSQCPPPSAANPQVQLTAPMPAGWGYLRVPEPSAGQMRLTGITRGDGAVIKVGTNAWVNAHVERRLKLAT